MANRRRVGYSQCFYLAARESTFIFGFSDKCNKMWSDKSDNVIWHWNKTKSYRRGTKNLCSPLPAGFFRILG